MANGNDENKSKIECRPNGPYIVTGSPTLKNSKEEKFSTKQVYALCRCGGSANKPFCDGTHSRIGFSSERLRQSAESGQDKYVGQQITIVDNRGICAHAGLCTDRLSAVFRLGMEPWINSDGAEAELVINSVQDCPSGALSYKIDGAASEPPSMEPGITVSKNGPYYVAGGPELEDEVTGQQPHSKAKYTLCRCGQSKNKPFCDGEHWNINFQDEKN